VGSEAESTTTAFSNDLCLPLQRRNINPPIKQQPTHVKTKKYKQQTNNKQTTFVPPLSKAPPFLFFLFAIIFVDTCCSDLLGKLLGKSSVSVVETLAMACNQ
jgi:hypothetical protein